MIFGSKAVEMPKTLAEMEKLLPELVAQAREEGKASIDTEAIKTAAKDEATASFAQEKERIYGLFDITLGSEMAAKLKTVIESGVTPEVYGKIGQKLTDDASAGKETAFKEEMLAAIKAAGAKNAGAGSDQDASDQDWATVVEQYQAEHKCTRAEAIRAIEGQHPGLRKSYLKRVNPGKEV